MSSLREGEVEKPLVSRQEAIERGLTKYFTGEECKHGHVSERYVLNGGCVTCIAEKVERQREAIRKAREAAQAAG